MGKTMRNLNEQTTHTFAYLDVETTGLSPWFGDRICEIAILRCERDEVIESFDSLLNPERPLSPGAARVNGLKDADLQKAPRFRDIAERVLGLAQDTVIVCHNAPFDLGFLSSELGRMNRHLPTILTLDTLEIARAHFDFDSNSLQSIAQWLDIEVTGAHRALDDVWTSREIVKYFARKRSTDIEHAITPYPPVSSSGIKSAACDRNCKEKSGCSSDISTEKGMPVKDGLRRNKSLL
jgi:DNA polymerase-3 subunit epsilon